MIASNSAFKEGCKLYKYEICEVYLFVICHGQNLCSDLVKTCFIAGVIEGH